MWRYNELSSFLIITNLFAFFKIPKKDNKELAIVDNNML